ncbi:MAG TPA: DUF4386 family protein, partial [Rhodobacterales bacterium]|nr:DUF4386 family protein [Rhodobacterales bacterium]
MAVAVPASRATGKPPLPARKDTIMQVFNDPQSPGFARFTGGFYLALAAIGPFSILCVPGQITVAGDAAATLGNLAARKGLFLAGMGGEAMIMLIEVGLAAMLYVMFRPVNAAL